MDTALPQKFPFILDRNLPKANCTGNRVCTLCDTVVIDMYISSLNLRRHVLMLIVFRQQTLVSIFHGAIAYFSLKEEKRKFFESLQLNKLLMYLTAHWIDTT